MAENRKHHYLPQFYLRGFTDARAPRSHAPFVWVRDAGTGVISRRAPQNVAVESGFYATHTESGPNYHAVEDELAHIESRAAFALRRYLALPATAHGPIPVELGEFIAWLGARVPWFRRVAQDGWIEFLRSATWGHEALPEDPGFRVLLFSVNSGELRRESLTNALPLIRTGRWTPALDQNQHVELMRVQAWYFRFKHFPALTWAVLTAPAGHTFVTSDRPVVWFVRGKGVVDSPAALRDPGVELSVPLDASHALLGLGSALRRPKHVHVEDINERTAAHAERFVIASTEYFGRA